MSLYPFKKILVSLDLSEKDESTIQFASKIAQLSAAEQVEFIYVAKASDLPEDIKELHLSENTQNTLSSALSERVADHFKCETAQTNVCVEVGGPLHRVLEKAQKLSADVIVAGKGNRMDSSAVFPEKLARKAPCSILVVPQGANMRMKKVVVPIDFSDYSKHALQLAIDLGNDLEQDDLTLLRAYALPVPYTITGNGWSYQKFCSDVRESAEKKLNAFVELFDVKNLKIRSIFPIDASAGHAILSAIYKHQFDFCIMGAKGKRALTAFFLGSTAEEVVRSTNIPVLIVKEKDEDTKGLEAMIGDWFN